MRQSSQVRKLDADATRIAHDLTTRAAIRREATCRGPNDRLANQLDEAAAFITGLMSRIRDADANFFAVADDAMETFGYDDIRFADVRHGALAVVCPIRGLNYRIGG